MADKSASSEPSSLTILDKHNDSNDEKFSRSAAYSDSAPRTGLPRVWRATFLTSASLLPVLVPAILLGLLVRHTFFVWKPVHAIEPSWPPLGCDSSGKIYVWGELDDGYPGQTSVWNVDSVLTINMGFGDMPFSTAKGIDVAWDFAVGRGAQAVSAIALYHIFRGPLAGALRQRTRPYDVALAMQYSTASTSSLLSYIGYAWRLATQQRQQWFHATLLVFATLYVLLLPTLLSAMSGYQAKTHPVLPLENQIYIPFAELNFNCEIIIADASRVGFGDNLCVAREDPLHHVFRSYRNSWRKEERTRYNGTSIIKWYDGASTFNHSGETFRLEAPTLHYVYAAWNPAYSRMFSYQGRGFTNSYLRDYGICQATQRYEWGFSFLLAFATLVVTLVLFLTLNIFWWQSRSRYDATHTKAVFGQHQTAITVAELLQEERQEAANDETKSRPADSQAKSETSIRVERVPKEQT